MQQNIEKWNIYEWSLSGETEGNPFVDVELFGVFSSHNREIRVRGFYDGEGKYIIRFMPDEEGSWSMETRSNHEWLNQKKDQFECIPPKRSNHGPVKVSNQVHFAYSDGTKFHPFGTTAYVWNHQPESIQARTLATLQQAPFNKIRMCVFPKYYDYNTAEPSLYPYEGEQLHIAETFSASDWNVQESGFDFERFNPVFFQQLERQIGILQDMNIEVDLILFHPYDHWGFASMGKEYDVHYLKYIIARLGAFRNIWWSLANEYDLMDGVKQKLKEEWDDLFQCVVSEDPYGHLCSIHNFYNPPYHRTNHSHWYDHRKPWVTHVSAQHDNMTFIPEWITEYNKPVIMDEVRYEGNLNDGWGNLTAQDMVRQFWEATCRGGYATHGETYLNEDGVIWWSHGGELKGESISRISFLRDLIEEEAGQYTPLGLQSSHWETAAAISDTGHILIYLGGSSQARYKQFNFLPEGKSYGVELIDTWGMSIQPLDVSVTNQARIELPSKPFLAIRLKEWVMSQH